MAQKFYYIFFTMDTSSEFDKNRLYAIKTNEDFRILSTIDLVFDNTSKSLVNSLNRFEKWLKNPYRYKFVTFDKSDVKTLSGIIKKYSYKPIYKDFPKMLNYKLWNIKSDMCYRLKLPTDLNIEDYIKLYGLTYIEGKDSVISKTFNLVTLVSFYQKDYKTNNELKLKRKYYTPSK